MSEEDRDAVDAASEAGAIETGGERADVGEATPGGGGGPDAGSPGGMGGVRGGMPNPDHRPNGGISPIQGADDDED